MPVINFSKIHISGKNEDPYSTIHISTPKKKFQNLGKLALTIYLDLPQEKDAKKKIKDKIQHFINLAINNFYNKKKQTKNPEKVFEKILQELNNWLQSE